jgi:hypothetical protein
MVNFVKFYSLTRKLAQRLKPHPSVVLLLPLSLLSMHAMGVPAYHSSVRVAELRKILPIPAASCGGAEVAGRHVLIQRSGDGQKPARGKAVPSRERPRRSCAAIGRARNDVPQAGLVPTGLSG